MPLADTVVLDCSRMLPGAVLARMLGDLGARVIKVEAPAGGDFMRHVPPLVDGVGAGFRAFYGGAESVALDLRTPAGADALRRLARRADVLVESFRPGTMERWGTGPARLREENPALVVCSLSAYGAEGAMRDQPAHDLNVTALSGLLSLLPGAGAAVPRLQLADVSAGMLACSAVLAALLDRARTGRGAHVEQPLAAAVAPLLTWAWADAAALDAAGAPAPSGAERLLGGSMPAYRVYACGDGGLVALGALEPKFWVAFVTMLGLSDLAPAGLDEGPEGRRAADAVAARLAEHARDHWLALARGAGVPLSPVQTVRDAARDPYYHAVAAAPYVGIGTPAAEAARRVPALGEHTAAVLAELGA